MNVQIVLPLARENEHVESLVGLDVQIRVGAFVWFDAPFSYLAALPPFNLRDPIVKTERFVESVIGVN